MLQEHVLNATAKLSKIGRKGKNQEGSFTLPLKITLGKMTSRREKIGKSDFAPPEKFPCYAPDKQADIIYTINQSLAHFYFNMISHTKIMALLCPNHKLHPVKTTCFKMNVQICKLIIRYQTYLNNQTCSLAGNGLVISFLSILDSESVYPDVLLHQCCCTSHGEIF